MCIENHIQGSCGLGRAENDRFDRCAIGLDGNALAIHLVRV